MRSCWNEREREREEKIVCICVHLSVCLMSHCVYSFILQWPWMDPEVAAAGPGDAAPWLYLFQNAKRFCDATV